MVGVPPTRDEEQNRLAIARGEFVASLPRRLEVLRAALASFAENPGDRERQNSLLRRIHALGSAAGVLGFASVAEVLTEAERTLRRATKPNLHLSIAKDVSRALELLPQLAAGGTGRTDTPAGPVVALMPRLPLGVLLFGPRALADSLLEEGGEHFELEQTEDSSRAVELARSRVPDVVLIDSDCKGAVELALALRADSAVERVPLVVLGGASNPDGISPTFGPGVDRVLPKPMSQETLRRTLLELAEARGRAREGGEPLGELTVEQLCERIASEVKKGLVESLELSSPSTRVSFGDGADVLAAIWGAVARVRELVTLRSSGNIRFQPQGPEGAVPFAPWLGEERRASERGSRNARASDDVGLSGRRVVIADDDPAVVWFLGGLLKAVGAEVIEAHDGERALQAVFETLPDLVISDILMPQRDGFSLCHEIKRDVAVRDVPVILLSWKEDLLQRVRELGSEADGYLRKEAAASTVLERIREVLRPRARIERRLAAGGEVRGRLDGITPRLVLELARRACPDCVVTIRDAVYLYEAQIRGGRLRALSRSAADGSFERGDAVLSALLGVNAGRFVVVAETSPCRQEFDAPWPAVLEGPVRRARAALAAVAAVELPRVLRVEVDLEGSRKYLECSPELARRLVDQLSKGVAPRGLLMQGEASAWLLEAVLSDLARRGALLAVERETSAARNSAPPRADDGPIDSAWSERPLPPDLARSSTTRASSDAVSDAGTVVPEVAPGSPALAASAIGLKLQASSTSLDVEPAPQAATEANPPEDGWFSFRMDATESRDLPKVAPLEDAESVFAALADSDEPPRPAPRASAPSGAGPHSATPKGPTTAPSGSSESGREPSRVGVRPVLRMPAALEGASPSMADVFAAALAESPPEPALASSAKLAAGQGMTESGRPSPQAASSDAEARAAQAEPEVAAATASAQNSAAPAEAARLPEAPERDAVPASEPEPEESASVEAAAEDSAARALPPTRAKVEATEEPASEKKASEHPAGESGAPPAADAQKRQAKDEDQALSGVTPAPGSVSPTPKSEGQGLTIGLAAAAFAVAFAVVRWGLVPALAPREGVEPASSATFEAPSSVPSAGAAPRLLSEELELANGVDPGAGRGLLEIVTGKDDRLYVDGTFVGRGPSRTVPLSTGQHEIKIVRGESAYIAQVELKPGRRTRTTLESSPPPKP